MKEEEEEEFTPVFSYEDFEREAIQGLYEKKQYLGEDGIFTPLLKHFLEKALSAELQAHLKEEPYNKRNGLSSKRVKSSSGEFDLVTPRDRTGSFTPEIVSKRQVVVGDDLCEKILSMYGKGMSYNDIKKYLSEIYGLSFSPAQMTEITDQIIPELEEWQSRPLDQIYAIVWFDAIHYKVKENSRVTTKALYNVFAVNMEGQRELLGIYVSESESASFWLSVMQDLQLRGVEDMLIACTDNLKGFSEAISSIFPQTIVQSCIVHQVRNTLKYAARKDYRSLVDDMKAIYTCAGIEQAEVKLTEFAEKWEEKYPVAVKSWQANWYKLSSFFEFGKDIRRLIYTTNPIENVHRQMRKITKTKGSFSSDMALKKLIYLVIREINKAPKGKIPGWGLILSQLTIKFENRISLAQK
ncbi:MAG TPA: IS256 family transposase [Ignavibacteriaceae bacterium]|nr:IS256 family transposase [Ignavibacteriaceae bacterium]